MKVIEEVFQFLIILKYISRQEKYLMEDYQKLLNQDAL